MRVVPLAAVRGVILVLTLGLLVGGGLPIITALIGVVVSLVAMTALASVLTIATAATSVGSALGISCGIDCTLFILSRHRTTSRRTRSRGSGRARRGSRADRWCSPGPSVIIALCGLAIARHPCS
jgi:putative drug exporter of the RND superfamily